MNTYTYTGFFKVLEGYAGWSFERSLDFYCHVVGGW